MTSDPKIMQSFLIMQLTENFVKEKIEIIEN